MCGSPLGPPSRDYVTSDNWQFSGFCAPLFFRVKNTGGKSGISAALSTDNWNSYHVTSLPGDNNPNGISNARAKTNPSDMSFLSKAKSNFDFTSWGSVSESVTLSDIPEYQQFTSTYNSRIWTYVDPDFGSGFVGDTWYSLDIPECQRGPQGNNGQGNRGVGNRGVGQGNGNGNV